MVHKTHKLNKLFKEVALRTFEQKNKTRQCRLIIAVDAYKFLVSEDDHSAVLDAQEWQSLLMNFKDNITLVTTMPHERIDNRKDALIKNEIAQFTENGINVVFAN